jgi:glyoxylase-like metal-dependent hydrolase (beta-lactamase superfamily II)
MQLSKHCHALTGFAYVPPWAVNAGVVAGARRTLIVDTGPTALAAATILGYAQAARPGNEIVAVDTERHLDHIAGNDFLRSRGIDVYGHPSIDRTDEEYASDVAEFCAAVPDPRRRAAGEGRIPFSGTRIAGPNVLLDAETELDLGALAARILLAPGHTAANLVVWVPEEGVLYAGDTVVSDFAPNLESGGPADWLLWLAALERIERLRPETLVPGHGRVLRGDEVGAEIARVRSVLEAALGRVQRGGPSLKLYFAGAISAGRTDLSVYQRLVGRMHAQGHDVLSAHVADPDVLESERRISPREIFERDVRWIEQSDALVAEVSTPSLGVGFEYGLAVRLGKPVLCLVREGVFLSRMVLGNPAPNLSVVSYASEEAMVGEIDAFLARVCAQRSGRAPGP